MDDKLKTFLKSKNFYRDILEQVDSTIFIFDLAQQDLIWLNKFIRYPRIKKNTLTEEFFTEWDFIFEPKMICELIHTIENSSSFRGVFKLVNKGKFHLFEALVKKLQISGLDIDTDYFICTANLPIEKYNSKKEVKRFYKRSYELFEELHNPFLEQLTKRELEVSRLIARGLTVDEVSHYIFLSNRTIETTKYNILKKTMCRNFIEFMAVAFSSSPNFFDLKLEVLESKGKS